MRFFSRLCVFASTLLFVNALAADEIIGLQNANLKNPGNLMQGDLELWSTKRITTAHALKFEDDVHGASAARFEIRPDDEKISDGYRAELRDLYVASPHEEVWYRFRTLIPGQLLDPDLSIVLAQWHDKKTQGRPAARPPLALRLTHGALRVTFWNDQVLAAQGAGGDGEILYESRDVATDQWIDFVFGVKWSSDEGGAVRMWIDGELVAEHSGAVSYSEDVYGPYFKLGIYTVHDFKYPLHVYHSDYRRAASEAELDHK